MTRRVLHGVLVLTLAVALLGCGCTGGGSASSSSASSRAESRSAASVASAVGTSSEAASAASEPSSTGPTSSVVSSRPTQQEPAQRPSTMSRLTTFYAPRQAACVYTIDITELDRDTVDMLRTLQGLLARCDSASLYLIAGEADRFWRTYASSEMGIYFQSATVEQILERFGKQIGGVMLYTPDTYEYETAFDLALLSDAIIATGDVARRYGLTTYGRVTDLRGAYADKQKAYADVLARLREQTEYFYLVGDSRAFADYAYAVQAPAFCLIGQEAWEPSFLASLMEREGVLLPAVAFTDGDSDTWRYELSAGGFGLLPVSGFANATFFASATTTRRYTPRQPSVTAPAADGTVSVSFLLTSGSLGDTVGSDYRTWSAQDGSIPVAYAFPVALCELAPLVTSWYHAASADNSRLIARGWCVIEEKTVSYEVYRKWHTANNEMMTACGLDLTVTDALREDTIYGENYGNFSTAAGIFVTDGSGDGSVWRSEDTPVVVTVNMRSLPALDAWLGSASAARRPLYYAVALNTAVFAQPYEILPTDPTEEPTQITFADVVKARVQADDSPLRLMTVENLISASKQ